MIENNSKINLTISLLTYLYSKHASVKAEELSEKLSLSKRSVRRLIKELRLLGYDISSTSGPYGGYRLNKSNILLPTKISEKDKTTFLAIENTVIGSDLVNKENALNLLNRIGMQSQLKTSIITDVYSTKKLDPKLKEKIEKSYKTLSLAIKEKSRVEIKYKGLNSKEAKTREFRAERFQNFNGKNYIKGYYNSDSSSFRTLRLSRIEDVKIINKKYSFNENFKKDNENSAFSKNVYKKYDVKLKIFKNNHDILDYQYGEDQKVEEKEDYYILSFTLAGDQIIKDLVLSMGKNCEILSPKEIRQKVIKEVSKLNDIYRGG